MQGSDPWNAARCIHGEPSDAQLEPDKDLGRATKPNTRNVVHKEEDRYRSFGVPTVRNDIPAKSFKSVANFQVSIQIYFLSKCLSNYRTMVMSPKLSI